MWLATMKYMHYITLEVKPGHLESPNQGEMLDGEKCQTPPCSELPLFMNF